MQEGILWRHLNPAEISRFLLTKYPKAKGYGKFVLRWRSYFTPTEEVFKRVPSAERVVDVGCGRGMLSVLLYASNKAKNVLGIDISENAINLAKDAAHALGTGIDFRHVSSFADWPQDVFDVVVCIDTLHHVSPEQQREFLRRLCRLCSSGGMLVFEDVPPFPWWRSSINTLMDLILSRQWVHYSHPKDVAELFRSEGFTVLENLFLTRLWNGYYLITARKEV